MTFLHLFVALAEFVLALLLFHQTLAALARHGRRCALRLWLVAMALSLMGAGRFTSFLDGQDGPLIYTFGHLCLIAYAVTRYLASRRNHGQPKAIYECRLVSPRLSGGA